jgi:hypothetical protein
MPADMAGIEDNMIDIITVLALLLLALLLVLELSEL